MDPARWQQIKVVFEEAVELPALERGAYLDAACGGDTALRRRVEALLAADAAADAVLEATPEELADGLLEGASAPERIGPYRVTRTLGRGGMGEVYLARRDDGTFRQDVALKVIRRGMDSDDILRRFRVERQILASLDHPHIARLYDGGLTEPAPGDPGGRPYFAMEYLEGLSITAYCDAGRLPIEARLRLFCHVCAAVQHAHDHHVIHRDIKPSNIIVTDPSSTGAGEGTVKLLDFGIAKVLAPDELDITAARTRTGYRLMTPEYASPEQIRHGPIAPASDIYSLGVVLYELLTGHRPYRTAGRATHELERVVCEDDPVRPSTAVSRVEGATGEGGTGGQITPESVSQARSTTAAGLRRRLRGELDIIVMKALHKVPERRYASVADFLEDVQCYLDGRPIRARRATMAYRSRKFVMRHRTGLTTALAVVGMAVGFGGLALDGLRGGPPPQALPAAASAARSMLVVLPFEHRGPVEEDYFAEGIADAITAHLTGLPGLGVIARNSAIQYKNTQKTPEQIGAELGVDYILDGIVQFEHPTDSSGRIRVIPQLIRVADNTSLWSETYEQVVSDVFDVQASIAQRVAEALNPALLQGGQAAFDGRPTRSMAAYNYYLRGNEFFRNDEDESSLRLAERMYRQALAHDSTFAAAYARLSKVHSSFWFHHFDRSEARRQEALAAAEQALVYDPDAPDSYTALGMYYYYVHLHLTQALDYFERALAIRPNDFDALRGKAWVLRRQGKLDEALGYFEQIVLVDPLQADYFAIALTQQLLRDYPEARRTYETTLQRSPNTALLYACLARLYLAWTGSTEEARRALDLGTGSAVDDDFTRITSVTVDLLEGQYQRALDRLQAMRQDVLSTQSFYIPTPHLMARAYRGLGQEAPAGEQEQRALRLLEEYLKEHPDDARALSTLGRVYAALGRTEEAVRAARRGLDLMPIEKDAVNGPFRAEDMAAVYTLVGRPDEALDQLEILLAHPGFLSRTLIEADPTWEALRGLPRYRALVRE